MFSWRPWYFKEKTDQRGEDNYVHLVFGAREKSRISLINTDITGGFYIKVWKGPKHTQSHVVRGGLRF